MSLPPVPASFDPLTPEWSCEVVDSCTGEEYRVDTISWDSMTDRVVLHSARRFRYKPPPAPSIAEQLRRLSAEKLPRTLEQSPDGTWKVRWRCPRGNCRVDIPLTSDTLNKVARTLRDEGASTVELADLAAKVSKYK